MAKQTGGRRGGLKAALQGAVALGLAMLPGAFVFSSTSAAAVEKLNAVASLPVNVEFVQDFLNFVKRANEAGAGRFEIRFLGGPEVIPVREQADALRRGVVDLYFGPASHYTGQVPEGDAVVASRHNAMTARASGGTALLDSILRKKLNARLLGHFSSGLGFHIYLKRLPGRDAAGGIDLTGFRMRSQPIYREFFEKLGATVINVDPSETYTALERGIVEGTGWPLIGITDLSWERFFKYRINPPFYHVDLLLVANLDRWNRLPPEVQTQLQELAIEYERISHDFFQTRLAQEEAVLKAAGIEVITLEGEAAEKFRTMAEDAAWDRLGKRDPEHLEALRATYGAR